MEKYYSIYWESPLYISTMKEMYGLIMLQIKDFPHLNVKMSDACIGTSAAPTQFPPYHFEYNNTEFNLVDGLFVASMPVSFKSLPCMKTIYASGFYR